MWSNTFFFYIGPFIGKCINELDLSDENLFKVGLLLKTLYGKYAQDELDPDNLDQEDITEAVMNYFVYVIRDVLLHAGFFGNANSAKNANKVAQRKLKMALGKFTALTQKNEYLLGVQASIEHYLESLEAWEEDKNWIISWWHGGCALIFALILNNCFVYFILTLKQTL